VPGGDPARRGARGRPAAVLALLQAWGGLTLAYYTNWPTSFWITALSAVVYGASIVVHRRRA